MDEETQWYTCPVHGNNFINESCVCHVCEEEVLNMELPDPFEEVLGG